MHGPFELGTLASIAVMPNATLAVLSSQHMVAAGYDAEGREVNITAVWVPEEDRAFATRLSRAPRPRAAAPTVP